MTGRRGERGAALLSVLLIVAAMTVAAVVAMDAVSRSVALAKASQSRGQAYWFARSAEAISVAAVQELESLTAMNLTPETPRLGEVVTFNAGTALIEARLSDATNCFNLNGLAASLNEDASNDPTNSVEAYSRLLEGVGLFASDADVLVDSVADWIDLDSQPRTRGAEDGYYASQSPPYRTSGTLLENRRELRAIMGYTDEVRAAIAPVTCVRPEIDQSSLNVNMLTEEQAPLLVALYSSGLDAEDAKRVLFRRPQGGWPDIESFKAEPLIQQIAPDNRNDALIDVRSQYIRVDGFVSYDSGRLPFEILLAAKPNEPVRVLWRRYGDE